MIKRLHYVCHAIAGYLALAIIMASLGAHTVFAAPGSLLFGRFHLASLYVPGVLIVGGRLLRGKRRPRKALALLWLSAIPFLTLAVTLQIAAGNLEFLATGFLAGAFGRFPAAVLCFLLFGGEILGLVKLANQGRNGRVLSPSGLKARLGEFIVFLGLAESDSEDSSSETNEVNLDGRPSMDVPPFPEAPKPLGESEIERYVPHPGPAKSLSPHSPASDPTVSELIRRVLADDRSPVAGAGLEGADPEMEAHGSAMEAPGAGVEVVGSGLEGRGADTALPGPEAGGFPEPEAGWPGADTAPAGPEAGGFPESEAGWPGADTALPGAEAGGFPESEAGWPGADTALAGPEAGGFPEPEAGWPRADTAPAGPEAGGFPEPEAGWPGADTAPAGAEKGGLPESEAGWPGADTALPGAEKGGFPESEAGWPRADTALPGPEAGGFPESEAGWPGADTALPGLEAGGFPESEAGWPGADTALAGPEAGGLPAHRRGRNKVYAVPVAGLLTDYPDADFASIDESTRRGGQILEQTLKEFKIEARVTGIRKGPVITMYELLPSPGVKISSIVNLQDNIALRLAASRVRMVAPIPGKHAIGIEVPNRKRAIVSFSSLVDSEEFRGAGAGIPVILGKDISGGTQVIDLTRTPHLLIAGATGSGKSVCVNSLIGSILYSRTPREVKMIMVDPKIVELKLYNDIPHLLAQVITEPKRAIQALQWCLCEMERRYSLLDSQGVRDMSSYNKKVKDRRLATEPLPYIVVIVDEFADLMATSGKELEGIVARLAAMSRAVGIHLVLATQRPSVDVITGLIKANFPSRIAFMVAGKTDSRIIIDAMGADKLLGRGDMLFTSAWDPFPSRMQGAFLAEEEVERLADHVKTLGEPDYIDDEMFFDEDDSEEFQLESAGAEDPMYEKALEIVVSSRKASASYLQRRLKIGYNRAARLVEEMENRGIIGPANGSKPRDLIHIPDRFSAAVGGFEDREPSTA